MMCSLPLVGSERKNLLTQSGTLQGCQRWMGPLESSWKEMRLQGTKRRCLSSDARCLGITTTWSLSSAGPAALLAPGLLSIHSTYPGPSFAEIKDSRICGQEHLLCTMSLCPSSLESSGCVKVLFVCARATLSQIISRDSLESAAGRTGETSHTRTGAVGQIVFPVGTLTSLQVSRDILCYRNFSHYPVSGSI